jgi:hypothetical protein
MVVLVAATLLANYHSHSHGAVFLTLPLAHLAAQRWSDAWIRRSVLALLALPLLVFFGTREMEWVAWTLMVPVGLVMARLVWLARGNSGFRTSSSAAESHASLQPAA